MQPAEAKRPTSSTHPPQKVNRAPRRGSRGFSVLEMMVAMSILGVSLIGVGQLLLVAIQQNDFARYNTAAIQLARGKIEELRAAYDVTLTSGQTVSDLVPGSHGPEVVTPVGTGDQSPQSYSVSWQVTDLGNRQRRVTVLVTPAGLSSPETDTPNRAKTVSMTGILTP